MSPLAKLQNLIFQIYGMDSIGLNTEINKLNTLSEENDRFIEAFEKEFNVNMSSFPYYDFYEEDQFILLSLIKRVLPGLRKNLKPLTVEHLLKVIEKGEWFY